MGGQIRAHSHANARCDHFCIRGTTLNRAEMSKTAVCPGCGLVMFQHFDDLVVRTARTAPTSPHFFNGIYIACAYGVDIGGESPLACLF
ncbi:MAG: hypothetical protein JWO94_2759 [Verrucomicrobiaceae bacterium]|nr:hypothetical protein [Verrucomicrobiaceae bacterium]